MGLFFRDPDIEAMKQRKNYRGLIKALRHKKLDIQWQASSALAGLGTEGMDHLLAALHSRNKHTRLGVIEALGEIRDPRAVDPLIGLLGDNDNEVRWEAALALGEIADPRAFGPLEATLRDPDRYVRHGSAIALEKMGWSPDSPVDRAFLLAGKQEWNALAYIGKDAIPSLDYASKDKDKSVRLMAVRTLGRIGEEKAIPLLYRAIRDPDDQVRWEAVMASQKCGISPSTSRGHWREGRGPGKVRPLQPSSILLPRGWDIFILENGGGSSSSSSIFMRWPSWCRTWDC